MSLSAEGGSWLRGFAWKDHEESSVTSSAVLSFPTPSPLPHCMLHDKVSYKEHLTQTQPFHRWCFNPTVVQSWSEGKPFKIIEFSNWNFKSNWEEMRAFPIWKASAQVFFPYFPCISLTSETRARRTWWWAPRLEYLWVRLPFQARAR